MYVVFCQSWYVQHQGLRRTSQACRIALASYPVSPGRHNRAIEEARIPYNCYRYVVILYDCMIYVIPVYLRSTKLDSALNSSETAKSHPNLYSVLDAPRRIPATHRIFSHFLGMASQITGYLFTCFFRAPKTALSRASVLLFC